MKRFSNIYLVPIAKIPIVPINAIANNISILTDEKVFYYVHLFLIRA